MRIHAKWMTALAKGFARLLAVMAMIGIPLHAQAASDIVLIDYGDPAYTVYA